MNIGALLLGAALLFPASGAEKELFSVRLSTLTIDDVRLHRGCSVEHVFFQNQGKTRQLLRFRCATPEEFGKYSHIQKQKMAGNYTFSDSVLSPRFDGYPEYTIPIYPVLSLNRQT